jgi:hypothetical protein
MKSLNLFLTISMLVIVAFIVGCGEQQNTPVENNFSSNGNGVSLEKRYNLPPVVMAELQLAKISTARYNNIENAIADGYVDINVVVPHMGHHYMNAGYLNADFDISKPEILVYSPNPASGHMQLVAIEYAIPNTEPQPDGFTGSYDVWDNNAGFGLWLLHAWVWEYNPDGVFTGMNPNVQ